MNPAFEKAMSFALTLVSSNAKTGPIPVSTSTALTCPLSCPFNSSNEGGCYANGGPLAIFWREVTNGTKGGTFEEFLGKVKSLPKNQLWRHNQAGDLPGMGDSIDCEALAALVKANKGKRGFTYTHKAMTPANMAAIKSANDNGFTINLSGNNPAHADELEALGIAPVVVVLPADMGRKESKGQWLESMAEYKERVGLATIATPAGNAIKVCPATYSESVNCANCGICATLRNAIIGFPAHGASKRKASNVANRLVVNRVEKIAA